MRSSGRAWRKTNDVPQGAKSIEADFQYLSPLSAGGDRIVVTPAMLNLQWDAPVLQHMSASDSYGLTSGTSL